MKKLFYTVFTAIVLIFSVASCNPTVNADPVLTYDLTATATGKVDFTWFNGGASIDGAATVYQCNDTTKNAIAINAALPLEVGLTSNNVEIAAAARAIRASLDNTVVVNGIQGEYQLSLVGYIAYGRMWFAIDEHYPPIDDSTTVAPVLTDTLATE